MSPARSVEDVLGNAPAYRDELTRLRQIVLSTGLTETIKWGAPCYTHNGKNVVGIGAFKSYFGLWFHQGALLEDNAGVLINAQEGKTKALRQWRMTSANDIKPAVIKRYIKEAVQHVDSGRQIGVARGAPVEVPAELQNAMRRQKGTIAAFRELSTGQQREYADYVAGAKRDETRRRRVDKVLPMIRRGVGLNDRYR